MAICGGYFLLSQKQTKAEILSCSIYVVSLFTLYAASTFSHSFFLMERTGFIFSLLDHAAIYLLIAGSYTPFCMVMFPDNWLGSFVLICVWILSVIGVFFDVVGQMKYPQISLFLYILIGWLVVFLVPHLLEKLPFMAVFLLGGGGVMYTAGVYFFIWGETYPMYHAIWHVFVLIASAFHFFAILLYVNSPPGTV